MVDREAEFVAVDRESSVVAVGLATPYSGIVDRHRDVIGECLDVVVEAMDLCQFGEVGPDRADRGRGVGECVGEVVESGLVASVEDEGRVRLARIATAADVAEAIVPLATDPNLTGTVIETDGGAHLTAWPEPVCRPSRQVGSPCAVARPASLEHAAWLLERLCGGGAHRI